MVESSQGGATTGMGGGSSGQGAPTTAGSTGDADGTAGGGGAKAGTTSAGGGSGRGGATTLDGGKGTGPTTGMDGGIGAGGAAVLDGGKGIGGTVRLDGGMGNPDASGVGGSKGTGGEPAGSSTCGTAAEGATVTLRCPQGQIIDSVAFASYGTPSGTCGSFDVGNCNSADSESVVQSQCIGHRSCSIAAANGTFGDPCPRTTKKLAVEVSCVVGESTVPQSPYKGIANSPASQIAALGATWCYNWGTRPQTAECNDPDFVPMVWGPGDVAGAIKAIGNAGYTTVLGFNEPNKADQANMSVDSAIALWPDMTSNANIRVSSPAVSDDGRAWLEDFMTKAQAKGLRVDFIAMHWYGWNAGSCVASQLEGAVKWASKWNLPIWITEFGCMGSSNPDEKTVLNFFNTAIPMLDRHPLVERYAWYPWNTYNHLYESNVMTALGQAFADAPQYRE